jgi:spore germination protein YaaH
LADGSIPSDRYPDAKVFLRDLHRDDPGLRPQAWIGVIQSTGGGPLDLADPRVRANIVRTAARFLSLGFQGIHYDIEPVLPGDRNFLALLGDTHSLTRRRRAVLSVATEALDSLPVGGGLVRSLIGSYHTWTLGYFLQVARRVDQIAVMTYGDGIPTG